MSGRPSERSDGIVLRAPDGLHAALDDLRLQDVVDARAIAGAIFAC
jgi:hypothetical protein